MESILISRELEVKFQEFRPKVHAMMLQTVLLELEEEPPVELPTWEELAVLLGSRNARVRGLGVRFSTPCGP